MTAIAGFVHDNKVWIGGDSAGVGPWFDLSIRADEKVFRNDEFLFGFTTSFRMGQLIRYKFKPPKRFPDKDIFDYMVNDFIDELRRCLKDGGFSETDKGKETGGTFLVGYAGRLFVIEPDYQVHESVDGYNACGCGSSYVLGSLYSSRDVSDPRARITIALSAAEHHSAGVRSPFVIESLPAE